MGLDRQRRKHWHLIDIEKMAENTKKESKKELESFIKDSQFSNILEKYKNPSVNV